MNMNAKDERSSRTSVIDVLRKAKAHRRPWQLLITGNTKEPVAFSAETRDALTGMFELFPHLTSLTLKTRQGDLSVTRDFPGDYTGRVDEMIAAVFRNDPEITGIVFPATGTRPKHTATPDDPHWSADGRILSKISAALRAGKITGDEAVRRMKDLHSRG